VAGEDLGAARVERGLARPDGLDSEAGEDDGGRLRDGHRRPPRRGRSDEARAERRAGRLDEDRLVDDEAAQARRIRARSDEDAVTGLRPGDRVVEELAGADGDVPCGSERRDEEPGDEEPTERHEVGDGLTKHGASQSSRRFGHPSAARGRATSGNRKPRCRTPQRPSSIG